MARELGIKAPSLRGTQFMAGDELPLARIRTDGGTQARAGLDESTVTEYTQAMQDGAQFPLIVVYHDGTDHWLADGFHRVAAARNAGQEAVRAEVRPGQRRDAVLWAVGANDQHGLRRSRADVQRAIETLLRDDEWKQWSDREIGKQVHCHHSTVSATRERMHLSGEISQIGTRTVERNGTTYQMTPAARSSAINRPDGSPHEEPAAVVAIAQRTPDDLIAAGVELRRHGAWFVASGTRGLMHDWLSGIAAPFEQIVQQARDEIAHRSSEQASSSRPAAPVGWEWIKAGALRCDADGVVIQARMTDQATIDEAEAHDRARAQLAARAAAQPDLTDIILRLDAHGYAKSGMRQQGSTIYYSFRDYKNDLTDDDADEIELAAGELPYWLEQLDERTAHANERQAQYLDAQERFRVLGWDLRRDGTAFNLTMPGGTHYATADLATQIKTLGTFEAAAKRKAIEAAVVMPDSEPEPKTQEPESRKPTRADYPTADNESGSTWLKARETADQALLDNAEAAIDEGCYADARTLLDQVQVRTVARDTLRTHLVSASARTFLAEQRTHLIRYAPGATVSQVDHKLALDHLAALLGMED